MPTPTLPLLHSLLDTLSIPIHPPSLSSTTPSLLLLILETLLSSRLPLHSSIRQCSSPNDEIAVVKCLLGVLGDDELGMDLTVVDPLRVVYGYPDELGVVIMALVVIAKRRGVKVDIPKHSTSWEWATDSAETTETFVDDTLSTDDEWDRLAKPLEPDYSLSFSSDVSTSPLDVFAPGKGVGRPGSSLLFDRERVNKVWDGIGDSGGMLAEGKSDGVGVVAPTGDTALFQADRHVTPLAWREGNNLIHTAKPGTFYKEENWLEGSMGKSWTNGQRHDMATYRDGWSHSNDTTGTMGSSSSRGNKTVLQDMLEEFGLS